MELFRILILMMTTWIKLYRIKYTHTACKTGAIRRRSRTITMSVSWLGYYTIVMQDVTIQGNWVKGIRESLCIISYNYMRTCGNLKIKSEQPKDSSVPSKLPHRPLDGEPSKSPTNITHTHTHTARSTCSYILYPWDMKTYVKHSGFQQTGVRGMGRRWKITPNCGRSLFFSSFLNCKTLRIFCGLLSHLMDLFPSTCPPKP